MEFQNDQPIYIQIANVIKEQIARGELQAGEKLWSVREYSVLFEVSALTVQRMMEYLVREGLVTSRKGIGSFVREDCVQDLQTALIREQAEEFVRKMENCGLDAQQIRELIGETLAGREQINSEKI